ncbi:hypothetical protein BKA82DRAFT_994414 [Pisolithus tinctorius]|uniref:Peptidase S1 domain-containing protein n=1 Tax=Pisolithus tinctorius Marx 270 TaxID=870435 RepID=A0A0C3JR94_PISTI|nr:hypothetical protein BKA82DRAFT_994414 [Pisolithus tinctorius]KIO11703.1 hypothetical protein M404DRAFT_994414 [Pisolithus tinctorius Marx 270]
MVGLEVPQEFLDLCFDIAKKFHNYPTINTSSKSDFISDDSPPASPEDADVDPDATTYYHGLPSKPTLVFRTGPPSEKLTGPETYLVKREIRPVFDDKFAAAWEDVGTRVYQYLDSATVKWTTIDIVRFAEPGKHVGPIVLWVGVRPGSLSRKFAQVAALACENILLSFQIVGVEIAFRESVFRRFGPRLLNYVATANPTASVCSPLTAALGLRIASVFTPYAEGTGALYLSTDCHSETVYVLTARHVVLPPKDIQNKLYHRTQNSQRRIEIMLLGPMAFQGVLTSAMVKIADDTIMVNYYQNQLDVLKNREESGDTDGVEAERAVVEPRLREAEASIKAINKFHSDVTKVWSQENHRVIGHVLYAPPITVGAGSKRYTEDWALIELDCNKIGWANFKGNVIDLGTEITPGKFTSMMDPDPTAPSSFNYPYDRLFPIQGVVPDDELARPRMHDANGEPCLLLIKNGAATGTTIGRGTGIKSFVRDYSLDGTEQTSMEFAILGNDRTAAFSARGDSGAVIVDGKGRVAALLTGGSGLTESTDITYGTPFEWLLERIKAKFPNAHLYPSMA